MAPISQCATMTQHIRTSARRSLPAHAKTLAPHAKDAEDADKLTKTQDLIPLEGERLEGSETPSERKRAEDSVSEQERTYMQSIGVFQRNDGTWVQAMPNGGESSSYTSSTHDTTHSHKFTSI